MEITTTETLVTANTNLRLERDAAREIAFNQQSEINRITAQVSRLEDELIASRYNEAKARETRDEAVVKIFKVMKAAEPCNHEMVTGEPCGQAVCILAKQIRTILTNCPRCKKHHPLEVPCEGS